MSARVALSPLGLPCNPPPWGVLAAVDLKAGKILWESPVGTTEEIAPLGLALPCGTPLVTACWSRPAASSSSARMDAYLRAFDAKTGAELWQGRLPVPGSPSR